MGGGGDLASINQYRWTAHSLDVLRLPPYIAISSVHHRPAAASHRGSECIGRRQRPTLKMLLAALSAINHLIRCVISNNMIYLIILELVLYDVFAFEFNRSIVCVALSENHRQKLGSYILKSTTKDYILTKIKLKQ